MSRIKRVVVIVTLVVSLIVIFQNTEPVTTRILFATIEMPRVLLLAIMVVVGIILGFAASTKWGGRKAKE